MAFYFVQFDQRSVTVQEIDPTAVDGMLGGLEYDEEIIEVADASADQFLEDVSAYNSSFGVYYGEPLPASDGKGEAPPPPLMAEVGVAGKKTGKKKPNKTVSRRYDEWNMDNLKSPETGEWYDFEIERLKELHTQAKSDGDYGPLFKAINRLKLSVHDYCCTGWKDHADYNMKKVYDIKT